MATQYDLFPIANVHMYVLEDIGGESDWYSLMTLCNCDEIL